MRREEQLSEALRAMARRAAKARKFERSMRRMFLRSAAATEADRDEAVARDVLAAARAAEANARASRLRHELAAAREYIAYLEGDA